MNALDFLSQTLPVLLFGFALGALRSVSTQVILPSSDMTTQLLALFAGDRTLALAAYNAGDEVGIILNGATQPVISSTTILQATLTREEKMSSFPTIGAGDTQIIPNASLQVWSPANPTLGDSDIIVTVAYKIVND